MFRDRASSLPPQQRATEEKTHGPKRTATRILSVVVALLLLAGLALAQSSSGSENSIKPGAMAASDKRRFPPYINHTGAK
jgi:hypothetical protein